MHVRSVLLVAGISVTAVLAACSASSGFGGPDADAGLPTTNDDAAAPIKGDSSTPAPAISCSDDLHSVIDAAGNVIKTCPADQGCGPNGTCVPACDSARANKSSLGCDYFNYSPDIIKEGQGACLAAYVANTWTSPITITVDYGGQALDATKFARLPSGNGQNITYKGLNNGQLQPGEVAILFLSHLVNPYDPYGDIPCPIPAAIEGTDTAIHGTGIGNAFHIGTTAPVVAYDIFPYGGGQTAATSATLLLPVSAWDVNYLAINAYAASTIPNAGQPSLGIIAQDDGTQVTIKPTADIVGATGVAATSKGASRTYSLSKGQVLQFTQADELSGSPIQANKPVAVFGGASALNIEPSVCCADSAHQQIPPVSALGSEYVGVKYRNRDPAQDEQVPWRVMGLINGTNLTYFPSPPSGAPKTLNSGEVVTFYSTDPFVVSSQDGAHPFYMSAHMTGCTTLFPPTDCRGDAEFVNVVPAKQFMKNYVFFTDPTYPETDLVVVRAASGQSFADVTLDCYGTLTGWQPIGAYEYTRVDLVRHNFAKQGNCDNGRHTMSSTGPFGVTVWGWGSAETQGAYHIPQAPGFYSQAVSYAYPAGMSVKAINSVVVPTN